jgi:hypothetical protein
MYKVYYLTTDLDLGIPMYVGATKLSLKERLIDHYGSRKRGLNKVNNWKYSRGRGVKIFLLQDNISKENIDKIEQFWIKFWKDINPDLRNSNKIMRYSHKSEMMITTRLEINKAISKSLDYKKIKVIVLNKDSSFNSEWDSVTNCSKFFKIKEESILDNIKDKRRNTKYIFINKKDYVVGKDYSYKVYKSIPGTISEKCRNAFLDKIRRKCTIENIITKEVIDFNSLSECANYLGLGVSSVVLSVKRNSISKKLFKIKWL